jgi:hypothetical protein
MEKLLDSDSARVDRRWRAQIEALSQTEALNQIEEGRGHTYVGRSESSSGLRYGISRRVLEESDFSDADSESISGLTLGIMSRRMLEESEFVWMSDSSMVCRSPGAGVGANLEILVMVNDAVGGGVYA